MPLEIVGFDRGYPCRCKFESCLAHFTIQAKQEVIMSIKKQRLRMLMTLRNTISDIGSDAKNQTPEILESNMKLVENHVKDILKLDGVCLTPSNSKVE